MAFGLEKQTEQSNFMLEKKMDRLGYSVLLCPFVFAVHLKISGL